jgi:hypothetical protein
LDDAAFQAEVEALLARSPAGSVKDTHFLRVSSNKAPWLDTGIDLKAGDQISTFSTGMTSLKGTPISFPAALQLWCRIGEDGEIFVGPGPRTASRSTKLEGSMSAPCSPASSEAAPVG